MDELDRQIIRVLQIDGRISNADIARQVSISEGTVRRRLERLTQEDVVKIMPVPNLEKMGYTKTILIGVQTGAGRSDEVGEAIARLAKAHYVARTTGTYDLFTWAGFELTEERSKIGVIEGVQRVETFVNLAIKKRTWPPATRVYWMP
jgi:Lrp/AsnC family transcriptional regulator, regulator for asnA, asnC and gidA